MISLRLTAWKLILKKWHFLLSDNSEPNLGIRCATIESSKYEKLLGKKIDNNLPFENYMQSLCKKANEKLNVIFKVKFLWS